MLLCAFVAALAGAVMTPARAQATQEANGGSDTLQEVTVTATRRVERLQDVPISVAAFSQEQLDAAGVRDIDALTELTPGVTFQRNGTAYNYNDEGSDINIRGIDSSAGTSTTGVYIDETPIQSRHIGFGNTMAFPELFDEDRIEVLRGPQGTLFGAGSEGGTVRFIQPQPSLDQSSLYALSEVGTTDNGAPSYEAGAAYGAPIIDGTLGFRVSASDRYDGGYVDRVAYAYPNSQLLADPTFTGTVDPNANWQRTDTFRLALRWAVNGDITVTPSFFYQYLHLNDTGSYWAALSNPSASVFREGDALANPSTDPFWLAAVRVDWNLGFAQLTSNSSYYWRDQHSISDYTQYLRTSYFAFYNASDGVPGTTPWPAPGDAGYATFQDKQNNVYEEVRLA